ncbi:MAG: pyridoxamine 5'-phosphate oxidase [Polyangiales bacterium]
MDYASLRREYHSRPFDVADADADPFAQFEGWFREVIASGGSEVNAMSLATADANGRPCVRMVLLKELDARGFVFFTNYGSHKAAQLAVNPHAALCFFWPTLERQVRVEGKVERVSEAESDAYFAERPRGSQVSAWASPQSEEVVDRDALERVFAEVDARYEGGAVPRPPHWGGYRVIPTRFEFWQGRASRMHDRVEYHHSPDGWTKRRLAP